MKKRIWELDVLRGILILCMVAVHFIYDLVYLYEFVRINDGGLFVFLTQWGGIFFFLLSGICVTLGSRPVRRGLVVFSCGMVCTAVTLGMYLLGLQDRGIIIYFGVLHCLGICMLLWPLMKKLPVWALAAVSAVGIVVGLCLQDRVLVDFPWLMPLGVLFPGFITSDYYPVFPYLGFFLAGAVLGRTVYRKQQTLFPKADPQHPMLRFFIFWGKWSLPIYLLHQPLITAIMELLLLLS